ncbi:MAG: hypothetical protein GQ583_03020 [Methyloprofundus sp.]|nr:hypothetical protein [Methyloprofundus sp.]
MQNQPTEFEKIYETWTRTKLELHAVTQRLQQVHQWLPTWTGLHSNKEAHLKFKELSQRRTELIKELNRLQQGELKKFFQPGFPASPGGFEPSREKLEEAVLIQKVQEQSTQILPRPRGGGTEPPPRTLVLWSYELIEYPSIRWSDDSSATFSKTIYPFNPHNNVQRGIVSTRCRINNPAPFDWPFIEEEHDWAQLMVCAALSFDIPAPSEDSLVFYETKLMFALAPDFSVRDYMFFGSCLLFEQHDAATGAPESMGDFEHLGNGYRSSPGSPLAHNEVVSVARNYFVPAGQPSKVHLGFQWNLSISSGDGGTFPYFVDRFIVFQPPGSDVWGLKVTQVPVKVV